MENKRSCANTAIIFGITALVVSTVVTVLFGWIAGSMGAALGLTSFVLGIITRKQTEKKRGKGGVIMGIIAIVFASALLILFLIFPSKIGLMAEEKGFPMIAKHARALSNGIIGMLIEMDADDEDPSVFLNELDAMRKSYTNKNP